MSANEIQLLLRAEFRHGVPAKPIIKQLEVESGRPLPDVIPSKPQWAAFQWPLSDEVNLTRYWLGRQDRFWHHSK